MTIKTDFKNDGWDCYECDESSRFGEAPAVEKIDGKPRELCGDCFDEWFENNVK